MLRYTFVTFVQSNVVVLNWCYVADNAGTWLYFLVDQARQLSCLLVLNLYIDMDYVPYLIQRRLHITSSTS